MQQWTITYETNAQTGPYAATEALFECLGMSLNAAGAAITLYS